MNTTTDKPLLMRVRETDLGGSFEQIARDLTRAGHTDDEIAGHFAISLQCYKNWRNRMGLKVAKTRDLVFSDPRR